VPASNDRNQQIAARARLGESHESIGQAYGISRQRVSQIVARSAPPPQAKHNAPKWPADTAPNTLNCKK
jgi:hypothetical protein